jgi:transmembrane protein DUF3566
MSDRTQGSVRTGARPGDTAQGTATGSTAASDAAPSVTATQSIPTTGSQRAQAAPAASDAPPATATQSIPTTGSQRAQTAPPADGTPPIARGPVSTTKGPVPRGASAGGASVQAPAADPATTGPSTDGPSTDGSAQAAALVPAPATGAAPATGDQGAATGAQAAAKASSGKQKAARGPRRARLQLRHIDTWSALKISLVLSIAMFFIWMVAVGILYGVLSGLGVFETLNDLFGQLGTASGGDGSTEVITPGIVFGGAAVIGAINIVLMTALCTVAAFIYNMCSDLVGGLEVTLSERD